MSRPVWRLIRTPPLCGAANMAIDETLLRTVAAGASGPVLRLYRWDPPTVSLGFAQRGAGVVNLSACRDLGFHVVRRMTGGRAVLHACEVTYAVVAPAGDSCFPGGVLENYRVIAGVLQQTLADLGLSAQMVAGRSRHQGGRGAQQSACFTAPAIHELVYAGCKMAGSAQKRVAGAFIQHGSIPVDLDATQLFRALDTEETLTVAAGAQVLAASVGWINRFLDRPVTIDAVEERLLASFGAQLEVDLQPDQLTGAEEEQARVLQRDKYGRAAWNLHGLLAR